MLLEGQKRPFRVRVVQQGGWPGGLFPLFLRSIRNKGDGRAGFSLCFYVVFASCVVKQGTRGMPFDLCFYA